MFAMERAHGAEINLRKDIPVDDEQRCALFIHEAEGASRAERGFLRHIIHLHAKRGAVAEVVLDLPRLEVGRHIDLVDPGVLQLVDDQFHQRLVTHAKHRLRQILGERMQPLPKTAGHNHGLQRRPVFRHEFFESDQFHHPALFIHDRHMANHVLLHEAQDSLVRCAYRNSQRLGRGRFGFPGENLGDRSIQSQPVEDPAACVAIGHRAKKPPAVIDNQGDARAGLFNLLQCLADRAVRHHTSDLDGFHVSLG